MDNRPIQSSKSERIARKTGMYVSLLICLAALIIGFWSAINRTSRLSAQNTAMSQTAQTSRTAAATTEARLVGAQQTDVKAEQNRGKASPKTAAPTTEKATINPVATFFAMPVGGNIIKDYSEKELKYSNTYKDWRLHTGVDIAAKKGTQIHAAGNGKVLEVKEDKLLGNTVVIDHGNGIVASYSGLLKPLVKAGQTVEAGTTIGGIGEIPCESLDESHLHLAVSVNGKAANPIEALSLGEE